MKHKSRTTGRRPAPVRRRSTPEPPAGDVPLAGGIRELHRAVAARSAARPDAHALRAFADSLVNLEAEYRRMATTTVPEPRQPPVRPAEGAPGAVSVPTPRAVSGAIVAMAELTSGDVVYVAGAGDGAVAAAAARRRGVQVTVIDPDRRRLDAVRMRAERARVARRVRVAQGDLFDLDLRRATVLILLASPLAGVALSRQLLDRLKPGTRIVSQAVDLGEWASRERRAVGGHPVRCWIVPSRDR